MNLPRASLLLPVVPMVLLHLLPSGGGFLSDDFTHFHWLHAAASKGELAAWLGATFTGPLPSGNFAYRPVVFASYALDYLLFGPNAAGWHFTNAMVHAANALLAGLLVYRAAACAGHARPGAAAFLATAFAAWIPFAGESTFWPVGRFDLLACWFSLLFLLVVHEASRESRWRAGHAVLMMLTLLLALWSKESAMPMVPATLGFALAIRLQAGDPPVAASRRALAVLAPAFLLIAGYLAWRKFLFGSAWKVYPESSFPATAAEAWNRVATLVDAPLSIYGDAFAGLAIVAAVCCAMLIVAWARRAGPKRLEWLVPGMMVAAAVGYLIAPATSFPIINATGEGTRNLYIGLILGSCGFGWLASINRGAVLAALPCLAIAMAGHVLSLRTWQVASATMRDAQSGIPSFMASVPNEKFVLLMLPDHQASIPFLRNAQGGIVVPPTQVANFTDRGVGMTPLQFEEWEQHFKSGTIEKLKHHPFDLADFLGVACWNPSEKRFALLPTPLSESATAWREAVLRDADAQGCMK